MSRSYVEYKIEDLSFRGHQKVNCAWSYASPLLALNCFHHETGGTVFVLNENGLPVVDLDEDPSPRMAHGQMLQQNSMQAQAQIPSRPAVKVSSMKWHPNMDTLAVCWESGDLGCYTVKKMKKTQWYDANRSEELFSGVKAILFCDWMNNGRDLVTGDIAGLVTLWSYDDIANQLTERVSNQLTDNISDIHVINATSSSSMAFVGASTGVVYQLIGSSGSMNDVLQLDQAVIKLLYYSKRNRLVIITENLLLCQYTVSVGDLSEVSKVKLSLGTARTISIDNFMALMLEESIGLIGICTTGERVIRLWQLESGQNAAVIVAESVDSHWAGVTSMDFFDGIMAAGTHNNHVIIWKRSTGIDFTKISQVILKSSLSVVKVGGNRQIAAITKNNDLYLIEEQVMSLAYNNGMAAIQISARHVVFNHVKAGFKKDIETEAPLKSIWMSNDGSIIALKTTASRMIDVYTFNGQDAILTQKLPIDTPFLVISGQTVWSVENPTGPQINLVSSKLNSEVPISDGHLLPLNLDHINRSGSSGYTSRTGCRIQSLELVADGAHLGVVMSFQGKNYLSIYNIQSEGEPKIAYEFIPIMATYSHSLVRINRDATFVANVYQSSIRIINLQTMEARLFDDPVYHETEILEICWATNQEQLLAFSTVDQIGIIIYGADDQEKATPLKVYDTIGIEHGSKLVSISIPWVIIVPPTGHITGDVEQLVLREFDGLTETTTQMIIDFMTKKKTDLSHMLRHINQTGSGSKKLWMTLAKMSVKSRDVQVGLYCVSRLEIAWIAIDMKKDIQKKKPNLALSKLAQYLEMYGEAEDILKAEGDKLALSKFYQARNEWQKAIQSVDRLNLKSVYYNHAKHLEQEEQNITEAIKYYEKSGTHTFEVPRMLFDVEGNSVLQAYCMNGGSQIEEEQRDRRNEPARRPLVPSSSISEASDPSLQEKDRKQLIKWWGQYCESLGDVSQALEAYEKANDYYDLVRLLCYTGEVERAKTIVNSLNRKPTHDMFEEKEDTNKDAAILHLGRHLEPTSPIESISYYLSCGASKHAMRMCKNYGLLNELAKLIISYGTRNDARDLIAKYEHKIHRDEQDEYVQDEDREAEEITSESWVRLYHKAGLLDKAVDFAIRTRSWSELRHLLQEEMQRMLDRRPKSGASHNQDSLGSDQDREMGGVGSAKPGSAASIKLTDMALSDSTLQSALEALSTDADLIDIVLDILLLLKSDEVSLIQKLILDYNIPINERLVEKVEQIMKYKAGETKDSTDGRTLLAGLADTALQQGEYITAAKLFNSRGDRVNSIKALIRTGAVDKVISYANVARDKQVYRIAANFLQTVDYENEKVIEMFYRKAGAEQELQRFTQRSKPANN